MNRRMVPVVVGVLIALPTGLAGAAMATGGGPVDVVEDYFAAIVAKDVDAALALVDATGTGVPVGDGAAFLDPRAIADGWQLEAAVEEHRDEEEGEARVAVTLASRHGHATRDVLLTNHDGPWRLYSPLVLVEVPSSPLAFFQANDLSVPVGWRPERFYLFPGLYEFYADLPPGVSGPAPEPVMAFPNVTSHGESETQLTARPVAPGRLSATGPLVSAVEQRLADLLDDCAEFATPEPYGCPFATDGEIDTPDGQRVREPEGLDWRVTRYPVVSLVDDRLADNHLIQGFRVDIETGGALELTGTGTDSEGRGVRFTVDCGIAPDWLGYRVRVAVDGVVELLPVSDPSTGSYVSNTCHRNP